MNRLGTKPLQSIAILFGQPPIKVPDFYHGPDANNMSLKGHNDRLLIRKVMCKPWAECIMLSQCPIPFSLPVVTSNDYAGICLLHETSLYESNRADSSLYHHSACGFQYSPRVWLAYLPLAWKLGQEEIQDHKMMEQIFKSLSTRDWFCFPLFSRKEKQGIAATGQCSL